MSVFKKLKGTFQNAQQDIVEGFRALAALDSQPKLNQLYQLKWLKSRDINLDAGADLLYNYQKIWQMIQQDTKQSAEKAEAVSKILAPMLKTWEKQTEQVQHLEEEVKAVPALLATLTQLHKLIDGLRQDFAAAERGLDMLENLCEETEHKRRVNLEEKKLAAYAMQRETEYQKLKVDLAQRHARKMAQVESTKRANLQERAEAFTSAFQDDLEYYRTHGHPDRVATEFPKVSSLSEIEIEQDKQGLDSFLGPVTESAEASQSHSEAAEVDTYFEDDYITGFSVKPEEEEETEDYDEDDTPIVDVVADADFVPDVEYLTIPTRLDALSVESLDDDSEGEEECCQPTNLEEKGKTTVGDEDSATKGDNVVDECSVEENGKTTAAKHVNGAKGDNVDNKNIIVCEGSVESDGKSSSLEESVVEESEVKITVTGSEEQTEGVSQDSGIDASVDNS